MRLLAFLAVLLCASTALAANPYLPAAKRLYESVEYDAALEQLNRARSFPGTTPQELVDIEIYTGLVKFELGEAEAARVAFRTALALDPNAELPKETSPKVRAEWNAIKQEIARLKVPETPKKPAPQPQPEKSKVAPAPMEQPAPIVQQAPQPAPKVDLAPHGAPEPAGGVAAHVEPEKSSGPYYLLGGAAVFAGGGAVFGLLSKSASSSAASEPVQTRAGDLDSSAHSRALAANVLFGAAAVTATVGAIWLLTR